MGNQNTSGIIVEEVEARNEGADNGQGVISPRAAETVENQIMVRENGVERVESEDKAETEDHKVSVEGSDDVIDISTNGSDLVHERSKLSDEEQEQPCTFTEDMQNPSPECTTHEAVDTTSDIQKQQNLLMKETLEADNHKAEKDDKDLVMAETAAPESTFSEARAHEEELGRDDEPPQEEQSNSINTIKAAGENKCFPLDHEEKTGNGDTNHTIGVDQYQPSDQEINHFLIRCSSDPMIKDEIKENGNDLLEDAETQEEKEATDQNVLEKALHWEESESESESDASATENGHKNESETTEKYESFMKIDTEEAETPPISKDTESEARTDVKKVDAEAKPSNVVTQVALRKSPSFDFGISFETRTGDSDQTPLLYQDKTARRSLSTCSNLRFPNQTEYLRKPLQFEAAVPTEEKTILMERNNSKQVNSIINNKQENASPSRNDDDNAAISPKGNGRRKARSSLFTTCICCTAAIS